MILVGFPLMIITFRSVLKRLSTDLASAPGIEIEKVVEDGLRQVGELFGVDRVIIAPLAKTGVMGQPLGVWVSEDGKSSPLARSSNMPSVECIVARLTRERAFISGNSHEENECRSELEALRRVGIEASAVVALEDSGDGLVAFGLDSLSASIAWPEDVVSDLEILGSIILSALQRGAREREMEWSRGFSQVVTEISTRLIHLSASKVDAVIEDSLGRVSTYVGVDLATLSQWTDASKTAWMVSHEWSEDGPNYRGTVIATEYPWLADQLVQHRPLVISSLDDLPKEAVSERESCKRFGIQSMIWVPCQVGDSIDGHIVLNSFSPRRWSDKLVPQLRMVGQVLATALSRQRADIVLDRAHAEIRNLKNRFEAENRSLVEEVHQTLEHEELVGRSAVVREVLHQVEQVAATDSAVLILGETGTGKGLIARAIHESSSRSDRRLVTVNCAALPGLLIESELFGYEKGAFTGAEKKKIGRFEIADRGTLFLDEIGDLPLELQAKLLRVLHDREFERLGSSETRTADVRIIAATNRNLASLVDQGAFRADLYHRLHVFPIHAPALRAHREDIPLLVWYFLGKLQRRLGHKIEVVRPSTMERLKDYDWPGNVRELQNILERAIILSSGTTLELGKIELEEDKNEGPTSPSRSTGGRSLQDVERDHIVSVLEECGWKIRGDGGAADCLGLKRTTLNSRMKKLGIVRPG